MLTIGLDVHQSRTSVCVLDAQGNTLRQQEVKGDYGAVAEALAKVKEPFQVCYEASTGYGALYERLAPLAAKVVVAHPGKLKLIFQCKKKHNRADAQKLATLLHLNQVPVVHVPAQDVRSWRGLIEYRRSLVDRSVGVKNQVRASYYGARGSRVLPGRRCGRRPGLAWLAEVKWPTALEELRLEILLEELKELKRKVDRVTGALDEIGAKHPGVGLLMTIPGVGPRTAEAFVAHYVDDPRRFRCGTIGGLFRIGAAGGFDGGLITGVWDTSHAMCLFDGAEAFDGGGLARVPCKSADQGGL